MAQTPPIAAPVRHLSFLLGTWRGTGHGDYPTIDAFQYTEEITFAHVGKPFLAYRQATKDASSGQPLHAEVGYLRPVGAAGLELALVQPSGIVELHEGSIDGSEIRLATMAVHGTATAKEVSAVARVIRVSGDELSYEVDMAAVGQPLLRHLEATLRRVADPA